MKKDFTDPIVEFSTLIEILRGRTLQQPEQRGYTYLVDGEAEGDHLTYAALDCQARSIGALLQSYQAAGDRALLLYPAGLEFIAAAIALLAASSSTRRYAPVLAILRCPRYWRTFSMPAVFIVCIPIECFKQWG